MRSSASSLEIGGHVFEWGSRTYVMGIVNTSPESFAGDGLADAGAAIEQGLRFEAEGADILDVGGQSTRPDFEEVGVEEEIRRVAPVVEALAKRSRVPISIDAYRAVVVRAAVDAGATLVND